METEIGQKPEEGHTPAERLVEIEARLSGAAERLWNGVRHRPILSLSLAAAVGALAGAELLAAGLFGGAAVLLLERSAARRHQSDAH